MWLLEKMPKHSWSSGQTVKSNRLKLKPVHGIWSQIRCKDKYPIASRAPSEASEGVVL